MKKDSKNTAIYIAYDGERPFDPSAPEKSLLRAILLSAMSDLKKNGSAAREAEEYFLSSEEDYIFSFLSICNFLNVDSEQILTMTGLVKNGIPRDSVVKPEEHTESPPL